MVVVDLTLGEKGPCHGQVPQTSLPPLLCPYPHPSTLLESRQRWSEEVTAGKKMPAGESEKNSKMTCGSHIFGEFTGDLLEHLP